MFSMCTVVMVVALAGPTPDASAVDEPTARLAMSEPIACRKITGYDDYEPLEKAVVTKDEKLLVYTRVTGHVDRIEKSAHRVHLIQDVNIRKSGQKRVIWGRKKVVDFLGESQDPIERVFLGTTIALQGIPPGEYEAELLLTDALNPSEPAARQTLRFEVVRP